ncbi:hypothetical protein CGL51_14405 [Pyrobaculum aerophilum]|uniref:Uncharacterized protein n=1 Tax=Pyrobaculum aerophilum TaxID=13773 RepID=A0A371QW98_9CREN|nr:hypothetical protein CGL51_14405 [Pyrobaculum aerophilum]RFA94561.1 hypothetical protein CGL52_14275 [Pyrobaculum aerophilum]
MAESDSVSIYFKALGRLEKGVEGSAFGTQIQKSCYSAPLLNSRDLTLFIITYNYLYFLLTYITTLLINRKFFIFHFPSTAWKNL